MHSKSYEDVRFAWFNSADRKASRGMVTLRLRECAAPWHMRRMSSSGSVMLRT